VLQFGDQKGYAPRFRSFRSFSHGRVFATFSAVSQARRAVATP
jgi:hypothetical protein